MQKNGALRTLAKIKLFSGMDFSGKTTTIKIIDATIPGIFKLQKKFLTPIHAIEKLRGTWLPTELWKPLLQGIIIEDIINCREDVPVLQDTLWIIKYIATKLKKNSSDDYVEIKQFQQLLSRFPEMDSFYLTATTHERMRRFCMRESIEGKLSESDRMLLSTEEFEKIEYCYRIILLNRFPNTRIIDTSDIAPEQVARIIMQDKDFQKDL
jgi:thymidylate kinase